MKNNLKSTGLGTVQGATISSKNAAKQPPKKQRAKPGAADVFAPINALKPYADFKNEQRPQDGQSYARMVNLDHGFKISLMYGLWACGYILQ